MPEQKFKIGDEVQHKSGGPKMVVEGYEPKDGEEVICEWFDKNTPQKKAFRQDVLKPYEPPTLMWGSI